MLYQAARTFTTIAQDCAPLPNTKPPKVSQGDILPPLAILAAYCAYVGWKEFTKSADNPAIWASKKEVAQAKATMLKRQSSDDFRDVVYQLGNVPVVNAVGSILSVGQSKTPETSVHNHLIHEHLKQGFPQVILDLDYPAQASVFVPLAQELGYAPEDIHFFVPGEPESGIWNPCDSAIGNKSIEISSAFQFSACAKEDRLSDLSSSNCLVLMAVILSMARHLPSGMNNVLGCRAILGLNDLLNRLREQREKFEKIAPWDFRFLGNYLEACGGDKNASSIAEAARELFNSFCRPEILPSVTGKTSFPLFLDGKKLLIIGCTSEHQTAVLPLLMAFLGQVVDENSVPKRQTPLQIAIDGVHQVRYHSLIRQVHERRMYGVLFNLAVPNFDVLESCFKRQELGEFLGAIRTCIWNSPFSEADLRFLFHYLQSTTLRTLRKLRRGMAIILSDEFRLQDQDPKPWKTKIKLERVSINRLRCAKRRWAAIHTHRVEASVQQPYDATLEASVTNAAAELLPELSRQAS